MVLIFIVLVIIAVAIWVKRKQHGQELDRHIYDTVHIAVSEPGTQQPGNYEIPVNTKPTGKGANPKNAHIYHTVMSEEAKDHQSRSNLKTPPLINGSSKGDKDGGTEGEEEYVEMYEDMSGADAQYEPIQDNQVQVHHYASLGATAQEEGSEQLYI